MPSPTKTQLNLSVDAQLKERFKALCETERLSLAAAFEGFMQSCLDKGRVLEIVLDSSSTIDEKIEKAIATLRAEFAPALDMAKEVTSLQVKDKALKTEPQQKEKTGITTKELAQILGVTSAAINNWEKGKRQPGDLAIAEEFSQWERQSNKRWFKRSQQGL